MRITNVGNVGRLIRSGKEKNLSEEETCPNLLNHLLTKKRRRREK